MPQELDEKDFIQRPSKEPLPLWLWLAIPAILAALLWGGRSWYLDWRSEKVTTTPFLQVTNRDFSQFLWQNPEYMRANDKVPKMGYLPAFQYSAGADLDPTLAEQFVVAPPEVLFRYHTWKRLLGDAFTPRSMPTSEFQEFLHAVPVWQPRYWPDAPNDYVKLVLDFSKYNDNEDLSALPLTTLPQSVRRAFQGWKNFTKEGEEINNLQPTFQEMHAFLKTEPKLDRSYWRNIVVTNPPNNYLKSMQPDRNGSKDVIPNEELSSFLRVAFFNVKKAQEK